MRRIALAVLTLCACVAAPSVTSSPTSAPIVVPSSTPVPTSAPTLPPPTAAPATPLPPFKEIDAFEQLKRMGRGVNLGNALEAPNEGDWGWSIEDTDFAFIKSAGFQTIRVPIRWSAHAESGPPYTIEAAFLQRVEHVVRGGLAQGLTVVINMHHYEELFVAPQAHRGRFIALWSQISNYFRDFPAELIFEPLNEPNGSLNYRAWNTLLADTVQEIRKSNPMRNIVAGPAEFNAISALDDFKMPADSHMIATTHYYLPFKFTHQGAEWMSGMDKWLGTVWEASSNERGNVDFDLDMAASWAKINKRPMWLGEFGAYEKADMDSRVRWTAYVAREAEKRGMAWSYWEYTSGFGVRDGKTKQWKVPLLKALIP